MTQPFSIVVGYDSTEAGGVAFSRAAGIARGVPGSELHLLFVMPSSSKPEEVKAAAANLKRYAADRARALGGLAGQRVGVHVRVGDAAKEIAHFANETGASLIVLGGKKDESLKHVLLGSVSSKVTELAAAAVMIAVLPPKDRPTTTITIDPPCPDCVARRQATRGAEWWCARHAEPHVHGHAYSYQEDLPWESHDSEVTATGI